MAEVNLEIFCLTRCYSSTGAGNPAAHAFPLSTLINTARTALQLVSSCLKANPCRKPKSIIPEGVSVGGLGGGRERERMRERMRERKNEKERMKREDERE